MLTQSCLTQRQTSHSMKCNTRVLAVQYCILRIPKGTGTSYTQLTGARALFKLLQFLGVHH